MLCINPLLNSSLWNEGHHFCHTSSDFQPPPVLFFFFFHRATSILSAWDTSKLIRSKSTCWWANCIRLICSGRTMPRFFAVLPLIKWWNHQGSALAAGVVHSKDTGAWQINSSSSTSISLSLFFIRSSALNMCEGYIMNKDLRDSSSLTGLSHVVALSSRMQLFAFGRIK